MKSLLKSTATTLCDGIRSPLNSAVDLSSKEGEIISWKYDYRSVIGSLVYLTVKTRPDIAVAVSMSSQHVGSPTKIQTAVVKRVLRYMKATIDAATKIIPNSETQLKS